MFHSKNTEGEKQNPCGSDSKTLRERESAPSVFWKVKHETKNETLKSYVSLFEMIDIHVFVSQGIEPWLTNADAGTRRPQVRTPPN